jgi:FKBP-type peptidyl-prolyl cis-trans isomerase
MLYRTLLLALFFAATALAGSNQEGLDFLAAKEKEDGVIKLASGLMYKEITVGTGKTPGASSPTKCHYAGTLIDGTEFDSSYTRGSPATFAPNQVIKGWTEGMYCTSTTVSRGGRLARI